MIKFDNVCKHYYDTKGNNLVALDTISLEIQSGEIFGIIGKSGAGKSTLIRCVNDLEIPTSGKVTIKDQCITTLNATELRLARRNIGMIFQHFHLLNSATVYDNITLPLKLHGVPHAEWDERITPLIELTHLEEKISAYPSQLSGGQKQRVAIARALASHPDILLCDEATSALDPHTTQAILQLLQDINRRLGVTILLITHEMAVIKSICDRVALLDQGKIIEENTVMQFFGQPQSELAKELVNTCMEHPLPDPIVKELHAENTERSHTLMRIRFNGTITAEPIIANLIQQQHVAVNIVQANMEYIKNQAIGTMIISLSHEHETNAKQYLSNSGIDVEVLGYVDDHV